MSKQTLSDQTERLPEVVEHLAFVIDSAKHFQKNDFSDIVVALKELGNGFRDDGCLHKIHNELRLLNKTLIMSALILSATKNPEKTLKEYHTIIDQYLD